MAFNVQMSSEGHEFGSSIECEQRMRMRRVRNNLHALLCCPCISVPPSFCSTTPKLITLKPMSLTCNIHCVAKKVVHQIHGDNFVNF